MSKYGVNIPVAGSVYIEVEAECEEEAIRKAWDNYDDEEPEWEMFDELVEGNVCHAPLWKTEVIQIEDGE